MPILPYPHVVSPDVSEEEELEVHPGGEGPTSTNALFTHTKGADAELEAAEVPGTPFPFVVEESTRGW